MEKRNEQARGLIHIYCGDGKGKTSAAVGLAVRAAGRGKQVVIARFLKTEDSGEVAVLRKIPGIHVIPCRKSFGFVFSMNEAEKREAAAYNRELFCEAVRLSENAGLLILDEIMAAVRYGMVLEEELSSFLEKKPEGLEVVLTGRDPSETLLAAADYVSEICKVRHPYDVGIPARPGIEY